MSIALYRKYRPATFGEVRGQEHVTDPLRQALRNGRVNHAYLFSGPRGCGKTSSARILARSLNCVSGPTPEPCGQCESCVALAPDGGGSIDVIEIDAASHGGVDDARELRERAFFAPVSSRYKVYVIDEAHMVTREGFNALLKLVEEPPPHLKFVFATTEPDKVISTIRSRTHHYPFRLIAPGSLRDLMEEILTGESIAFEAAALPLVVRAGGGSARDALSILDQLLAGSDERGITREGAVALLGYTDSSLLSEMVDALGTRDGAQTFQLVDQIVEAGHDLRRFTADLLERIRDLVVVAAVPDALDKGLINVVPDAVPTMQEQAQRLGSAELTRIAEILNTGLTQMRGATAPRLLVEILCARVLVPAEESVAAQPPPAAAAPAAPAAPAASAPAPAPAPEPPASAPEPAAPTPSPASAPEASTPAPPDTPARSANNGAEERLRGAWPQILEEVKRRRRFSWMVLTGGDVQVLGVTKTELSLGFPRPNDAKGFVTSGADRVLKEAIQTVLGVELQISAGPLSAATRPATPASAHSTQSSAAAATSPPPASTAPSTAAPSAEPSASPDGRQPQRHPDPDDGGPIEPPDDADPAPLPEAEDAADATTASSAAASSATASGESGAELLQRELGAQLVEKIDHQRS